MKKGWRLAIFITVFSLLASLSSAWPQQGLIQAVENGEIDWAGQVIRATGSGVPNTDAPNVAPARLGAERAARADALRNILETVKGVRIDSRTLVVNAMTQDDSIRTKVHGIIRGARVVNTRYLSDGAVEITVEIPMPKSLYPAVLPPTSFGTQAALIPKEGSAVFTGVVFDCRGLGLHPAISPKVFDEEGREVYGSAFLTREWANKFGILSYVKNPEGGQKKEGVTANPLHIKALRISGPAGSDFVISNQDAQKLRELTKNLTLQEQCRVLAVVD